MAAYHGYTIDDMVAMATARGCSYGTIQQALEFGAPMPPLRQPVKWPRGSAHRGEDTMGQEVHYAPEEARAQRTAVRIVKPLFCTRCGEQTNEEALTRTVRIDSSTAHNGRMVGCFCPKCMLALHLGDRPTRAEMRPHHDDDGNKLDARFAGRCSVCRRFFRKQDGITISTRQFYEGNNHIHGYLCPNCVPAWLAAATKKSESAV